MAKAKVKIEKTAIETAKDRLIEFCPHGAAAITKLLKPLTYRELYELAGYFNEEYQAWGQSEGYDLEQIDETGIPYYSVEDAIEAAENMLNCVSCIHELQYEIARRDDIAAEWEKNPHLPHGIDVRTGRSPSTIAQEVKAFRTGCIRPALKAVK
jgi:hypothetical protein